jgi:hypothetical protein
MQLSIDIPMQTARIPREKDGQEALPEQAYEPEGFLQYTRKFPCPISNILCVSRPNPGKTPADFLFIWLRYK